MSRALGEMLEDERQEGIAEERAAIVRWLKWNGDEKRGYSDAWKRVCRQLADDVLAEAHRR